MIVFPIKWSERSGSQQGEGGSLPSTVAANNCCRYRSNPRVVGFDLRCGCSMTWWVDREGEESEVFLVFKMHMQKGHVSRV